jgi:monoamine oxidase
MPTPRPLSRRALLRLFALSGAVSGIALSRAALGPRPAWAQAEETASDVLVIGAGIAGLAAARTCAAAGLRVRILEAASTTGGRIRTDRTTGLPLDLGASWIHGGDRDNPIRQRADSLGLETVVTDYAGFALFDGPARVGDDALDAAYTRFEAVVAEALAAAEAADEDRSLRAALEAVGFSPAREPLAEFFITGAIEQESGAAADALSAWWLGSDEAFEGDDRMIVGGYDAITDALTRECIAAGVAIQLGQRVSRITHDGPQVYVETDTGASFSAARGIITLPLGVLKRPAHTGGVHFIPGHSARKQAAIERLGMGLLTKSLFVFPRRFWPADGTEFGLLSQPPGRWAQWFDFTALVGAPVLLGFNAADEGARVEALDDAARTAEAMAALRAAFGRAVPDPTAAVHTRWLSDPFTYGAYSFLAVGASPEDRDALAAPEGRLLFAGEATSRQYAATVHGAYLSGVRAGEETIRTGA